MDNTNVTVTVSDYDINEIPAEAKCLKCGKVALTHVNTDEDDERIECTNCGATYS